MFVCWDMCMLRLFFSCPYAEYTGKAFRNSLAVGDVSIVLGGEGGAQICGGMGRISSYHKVIVVNIDSTAGCHRFMN